MTHVLEKLVQCCEEFIDFLCLPVCRSWRKAPLMIAFLVLIAAPLLHLYTMDRSPHHRPHNDLIPVLTGVKATLRGIDPYSSEVTREIQAIDLGRLLTPSDTGDELHFAYPAYAAIVLAPLAVLPLRSARILFLIITALLMAASVPMWLQVVEVRVSRRCMAASIALTLASWPMMWAFHLCQVTLLAAAFVVTGCLMLKKGWDVGAGVAFCLATFKPQLTGPLIIWLLVWAFLHRRWTFIVAFVAATSTLLLSSLWMTPGWIPRWLTTLAEYARYTNIQPELQFLFGWWIGGALMVALAGFGSLALWRMRLYSANSPEFGVAIALVLTLTLCLVPSTLVLSYNQVLLLPALFILTFTRGTTQYAWGARQIVLILLSYGFVAIPIEVISESLWGISIYSIGIPVLHLLVLPACTAVAIILHAYNICVRREHEYSGACERSQSLIKNHPVFESH